jgi:hypothetical protein
MKSLCRVLLTALCIGSDSFADDLPRLYEKAYFLETAKGQTDEALGIYQRIIQLEPTEDNREQLAKAANRLIEVHEAQRDRSFAAKIENFDMTPRFHDQITGTFGKPEAIFGTESTFNESDLPNAYTMRYPNGFWIVVKDDQVEEYRFNQPHIDLFTVTVGSSFHSLTNLYKPRASIETETPPEIMTKDTLYRIGASGRCIYSITKDEYFDIVDGKVRMIVLRENNYLTASYKRHSKGCDHMRKVPLPPPSPDQVVTALESYIACVETAPTNHAAAIQSLERYLLALGNPLGDTLFDKLATFDMKSFPAGHVIATFGEPAAYLRTGGTAVAKEKTTSIYTMAYPGGFGVKVSKGKISDFIFTQPAYTFNGIGVGSSVEELLSAFPPRSPPTQFWKQAVGVLVVDSDGKAKSYRARSGLFFEFISGTVHRIRITDNRKLEDVAIEQRKETS